MTHTTATGGARPFRFGVVAPLTTDLPTWRDRVHRIADTGYSTLLMPDGHRQTAVAAFLLNPQERLDTEPASLSNGARTVGRSNRERILEIPAGEPEPR